MLESFWREFLLDTGRDLSLGWDFCDHFGSNESMCRELTELILSGKKRATCTALAAFEILEERPPRCGDLTLVTNWQGEPVCVVRTGFVREMPFSRVSEETALMEGEDDSLASWRRGHEAFFREDGAAVGYVFSPDMPVVFEEIELVWPEPA